MTLLSLGFASPELEAKASTLAARLNLPVDNQAETCLWLSEAGTGIKFKGSNPLYADFTLDTWKKRRDEGKSQALVRAVKPVKGMLVIDATAGWGRDAAILASLGAEVLMIERNPLMALVLADALERQDEESRANLKLTLYSGNAGNYLQGLTSGEFPEVIYIDPMHPERQKSALVKKDLQILQKMIGEDKDAKTLLEIALACVKQKVIVKWPQKSPALLATPSSIAGKTVRFDIYPALPKRSDRKA